MEGRLLDGRYRLTARLEGGGMGEVWRGRDERIGRDVAVKIVTAARLTPDALARFDREARIAGNLSGPNIVVVHDYGHSDIGGDTVPYLVMELLTGRTLGQIVADRIPPLSRSLRWAMQICDALEIAHRAGVVHRDIKPGNVMVTDDNAVKVLDFGIARFVEDEQLRGGLTATGMIVGSAEYMSPEQAEGRKSDYRSDLYSLGMLLYFLATSRPAFEADSFMAVAYQQATKQPEPPSAHRADLPAGLDRLVMALLAKDPAERPESAAAVRKQLGTLQRQERERERAAGADGAAAAGPESPAASVTPPNTGVWNAPQLTQATEMRQYPGDQPPAFPLAAPPETVVDTSDGKPVSRRAFTGAAAVIGLGGAGGAAWWLLAGSKKPAASPSSAITPHVTGPAGAATTPATKSPATAAAPTTAAPTTAASTTPAAATPHNPTFVKALTGHTDHTISVAFTPDSKILASASADGTARLWNVADPANPSPLGVCRGHTGKVWSVAVSFDGRMLATGSFDKTAILWDISHPEAPVLLGQTAATADVLGVALSPDGQLLATAHNNGTAVLWNLTDPKKPTKLGMITGHKALVYSVAFAPTAKILATGSFDLTAKLWDYTDPANTALIGTLDGHTAKVFNVAFRRDGDVLAVTSSDKSLQLWDLTKSAAPKQLSSSLEPDETTGVAFSPDGRTVATGCGASKEVRLWDVTRTDTPQPLDPLEGHTDYTYGVAFSPNGQLLASTAGDHTIRLWRF